MGAVGPVSRRKKRKQKEEKGHTTWTKVPQPAHSVDPKTAKRRENRPFSASCAYPLRLTPIHALKTRLAAPMRRPRLGTNPIRAHHRARPGPCDLPSPDVAAFIIFTQLSPFLPARFAGSCEPAPRGSTNLFSRYIVIYNDFIKYHAAASLRKRRFPRVSAQKRFGTVAGVGYFIGVDSV